MNIRRFFSLSMLTLALVSAGAFPTSTHAQENTNSTESDLFPTVNVENATKPSDEQTTGGMTFLSGEEINTSEPAPSDLFAGGYSIVIDETVDGDIFAAGNNVVIDNIVQGDLRIAANSVTISNIVHGNALIFANSVVIDNQAIIAGHLNVYANQVTIEGTVEKTTTMGASHIIINGPLKGRNNITGELVTFGEEAQLSNPTHITAPTQPILDGQATGTENLSFTQRDSHYAKSRGMATQSEILRWFFSFLLFSMVGAIAVLFQRTWFHDVALTMEKHNALAWWRGLLFVFSVPCIALILMLTIIGIPFALVGMILYGIALLLGQLCTAFLLGRHVIHERRRTESNVHMIFTFVIGYFILSVIMSLPWIGWLFTLLAAIWGIGGILIWRQNNLKRR